MQSVFHTWCMCWRCYWLLWMLLICLLCPFCLFAVSVILICYWKCLRTVQKSFFVKEAYDATFIVEELMALEWCCSLSAVFSGIHNHTSLSSTYLELIGIRPEKAKFSAMTVITVGFETCKTCSSQQPSLETLNEGIQSHHYSRSCTTYVLGSWLCFKLLWVDVCSILASPTTTGVWTEPARHWWLGATFFEGKMKQCGLPLWKACCPNHNLPCVSGQGLYTGQRSVLGCQPDNSRVPSQCWDSSLLCHRLVSLAIQTEWFVEHSLKMLYLVWPKICRHCIVISKAQIKFLDVHLTSWIATALTAEWFVWRSMNGETESLTG